MLEASRIIDRSYVLHEKLGEGGMGTVFRATHRLSSRIVALKLIGSRQSTSGDHDGRTQLFLALAREFQVLSSLHHPNIIHVLEYGFDEETGPYLSMELLTAPRTLTEATAGRTLQDKVLLLAQLLRAISYLHRRDIIHRDLKPTNVLCVGNTVKVLDFGLAAPAQRAENVAGTREYMAPELWLGAPPSVESDLYSLGVIAYEVLTGILPFPEQTRALLAMASTEMVSFEATQLPGVAEDIERQGIIRQLEPVGGPIGPIISKLLARDPTHRYRSATDVLRDIGDALELSLPTETVETRESFLQASELIGRKGELRTLSHALRCAIAGEGSGWLLSGESGVGKSRLAAELRTKALIHRMCVATGQAVAEGGGAYEVWMPVLRALSLRVDLSDEEAAVLGQLIPDLPSLLGRELPELPKLAPTTMQGRLMQAIEALFRRQQRPVLVLLEDLQWAGEDSIGLLAHMSKLAPELPLIILGNYRDEDAPMLPEALPMMRILKLERLDRENIAKLCISMLGNVGDRVDLIEYLSRETEGNVFFLIEVVRALAEQAGQLDRVRQVALPAHMLTGGIERIAKRRVDRIPQSDRPLLDIAATLGRKLDLAVLQALVPQVDTNRWLLTCANAAVLESQGGDWRFAHDKLREAILSGMPPERRRELHGEVARAVEAVYSGPSRDVRSAILAHHFQEAGEHDRAAEYRERAGDIATRLCSYGEARAHFNAALFALAQLTDSNDNRRRRVDILLKQIYTTLVADTAEQNFKRADEAHALLRAIEADAGLTAEDNLRLARMHYFYGRIHFYRAETHKAIEYYRKVLPAGQESGDEELIALPSCLIGTAMLIQGNAAKAEPLLAQAIGPLERLGEPFEWFRAVGYHGLSLALLGHYEEGVSELQRVIARAREIRQPNLLSASHIMAGSTYLLCGDWPGALLYLRDARAYATETGDKLHLNLAWSGIGWACSHLGSHDEARSARATAQEIAKAMGGRLMLDDWYRAGDAEIALNAGRLEAALELAREVVAMTAPAGLLLSQGIAERVWGEVLARHGLADEADAHMKRSIAVLESGGLYVQSARTRLCWGLQRVRRGQRAEGERLHRESHGQFERYGCRFALAEAVRCWNNVSPDR